ncbi:hypothetical protein F2Q69_00023580 [Brassica cretica]|uniref:Uncharacterized protein n=1 Tax=Brassica cretica TaxID=69181 RepID=A0A8S9QPN8_BRACR|nr:hypothetical protein F2Q69_00023580 [Brassica cretica]
MKKRTWAIGLRSDQEKKKKIEEEASLPRAWSRDSPENADRSIALDCNLSSLSPFLPPDVVADPRTGKTNCFVFYLLSIITSNAINDTTIKRNKWYQSCGYRIKIIASSSHSDQYEKLDRQSEDQASKKKDQVKVRNLSGLSVCGVLR